MNYTKYIVGVLVVLAIAGGYFFPKGVNSVVYHVGSSSPTGSTFGDAKVFETVMAPSTIAGTTTSALNTDAGDRWITGGFVNCQGNTTALTYLTGAGLTSTGLTLKAATTSVANSGIFGSTVLAINMNLATSTTFSYNATTTFSSASGVGASGGGAMLYDWTAGSNLTFVFNATTTAGSCAVGVTYVGS